MANSAISDGYQTQCVSPVPHQSKGAYGHKKARLRGLFLLATQQFVLSNGHGGGIIDICDKKHTRHSACATHQHIEVISIRKHPSTYIS